MKKILLALCLLTCPAMGQGFKIKPEPSLAPKLDLGQPPQPWVVREIHNGQWLAGYMLPVAELQWKGAELVHLRFTQTWNAEHGNPGVGAAFGKQVTLAQLGKGLDSLMRFVSGTEGVTAPKWIKYVGNVTSFDLMGEYMPVHTRDVNGPWLYGFGAAVDFTDVFKLLSTGL